MAIPLWFVLYPLNNKEKHQPMLVCFHCPCCTPPFTLLQKTAPLRMCGFWAFDRVKPTWLLEGPKRNNPTIQDQACNSRSRDMCCKTAGEKKGAREKERGDINVTRQAILKSVAEEGWGCCGKFLYQKELRCSLLETAGCMCFLGKIRWLLPYILYSWSSNPDPAQKWAGKVKLYNYNNKDHTKTETSYREVINGQKVSLELKSSIEARRIAHVNGHSTTNNGVLSQLYTNASICLSILVILQV